jgi:hypothetical protein
MNDNQGMDKNTDKEYQSFAIKRALLAVVLMVALVWALAVGLSYIDTPRHLGQQAAAPPVAGESQTKASAKPGGQQPEQTAGHGAGAVPAATGEAADHVAAEGGEKMSGNLAAPSQSAETAGHPAEDQAGPGEAEQAPAQPAKTAQSQASTHAVQPQSSQKATEPQAGGPAGAAGHQPTPAQVNLPPGVAFVNSVIEPIEYELKKRFWGWRPNDFLDFTDNTNNFQLGVLEVTRRSVVQLAERLSRTGSTDSFNPHLENSMNWLMVTATRYWFPSPEGKYKESLDELVTYRDLLIKKRASFYTRTDNLIPLLAAYEDLLGSCDENLVKYKEEDGEPVSFFKADNYFYYAKGVASAMANILEAIHHDFEQTLDGRHATELLHHALESCRRAAALDPWIITDGSLDGFLANHRANIAAPISHARFYMGQLVKTLST